jgi:HK97 family phage major capsid protein
MTRRRETVLASSARMSLEQVSLQANSLFALSYGTDELTTDSPIAFMSLLEAGFNDELNARNVTERLFGKGGGEPLGILGAPCTIAVAKQTGQVSKTIVTENIDAMVAACWRYFSRGVWLANEDTFPLLQGMTRSVGAGGTTVNYLTVDDAGQFLLLGRPIFFSEFLKSVGTSGDIVLGAWTEYLYGVLQPLQGVESVHVRYDTSEHCFKFWIRNAGTPWWKAPLTPRNSATKRSPFVVLADRP